MKRMLLLIIAFSFVALLVSERVIVSQDYDALLDTAKAVEEAFGLIGEEKERLGLEYGVSPLIGAEYTGITTTLGALESKTTSANPNFSSVIYRYYEKMDLTVGDTLAMNLSSSFPALNIQAIIVAEHMGLKPIIMTSIGASTHGATDPEFTYLDMENMLFEAGAIDNRSVLISPGGDDDLGTNMDQELLKGIIERLTGFGYDYNTFDEIEENIAYRIETYGEVDAFINIGGNYVSKAHNDLGYFEGYGLLTRELNVKNQGLIAHYLSQGKPVLHLLNIKDIAFENNLPIDPEYPVALGEGGGFYRKSYSMIWVFLLILSVSSYVVVIYYDDKNRKEKVVKELVRQQSMD